MITHVLRDDLLKFTHHSPKRHSDSETIAFHPPATL